MGNFILTTRLLVWDYYILVCLFSKQATDNSTLSKNGQQFPVAISYHLRHGHQFPKQTDERDRTMRSVRITRII